MRVRRLLAWALPGAPAAALVAVGAWLLTLPGGERQLAAFATSLRGRTQSQVQNVRLALAALDGAEVEPGGEFSFTRTVGPWTRDRGYRKAPVSYSGDLTLDWGGGVCQASSTLYNAALLAGLPIGERHRHYWPASYVPPGRDAAVAYPSTDLRFRNPLPAPVRISAHIEGESLVVRLFSRARPPRVAVHHALLSVAAPTTVVRARATPAGQGVFRGQPGCEVAVYRVFAGPYPRRELVSHDTYPPQHRIIWH
mgnify:CR=1 FL=1